MLQHRMATVVIMGLLIGCGKTGTKTEQNNQPAQHIADFQSFAKEKLGHEPWFSSIGQISESGTILNVATSFDASDREQVRAVGDMALDYAKSNESGKWINSIMIKGKDGNTLTSMMGIRGMQIPKRQNEGQQSP